MTSEPRLCSRFPCVSYVIKKYLGDGGKGWLPPPTAESTKMSRGRGFKRYQLRMPRMLPVLHENVNPTRRAHELDDATRALESEFVQELRDLEVCTLRM